jgi:hypothetical protein
MNPKDKQAISETKLFNESMEYFNLFDDINGNKSPNARENNKINILREQMLAEINNLKELIFSNPDISQLSDEEKELFKKFMKAYSLCPICGAHNHYFSLKKVYFNNDINKLKKFLINNVSSTEKKIESLTVITGIPCCDCFEKYLKS